jgi:DNA-binding MarR family transcriptional regulator
MKTDIVMPKARSTGLDRLLKDGLGRDLSAATVFFHEAVAERLGLSVTDHKTLDLAARSQENGTVTPGRLAELTGLTTGAITGVLDRLEKAGFIKREKDPSDRRQVVVRLLPSRMHELARIFEPYLKKWEELCSHYDDRELTLIADYLERAIEITRSETERVRAEARGTEEASWSETREASAPLGGARHGRLELSRGGSNFAIASLPEAELLFRARFEGEVPKIRTRSGHVVIEYVRSALRFLEFRSHTAEIALAKNIPWAIAIRGGASAVRIDARALTIDSIEIAGGASDIDVRLGRASGTAAVRIAGGANNIRVTRPPSVPARVEIAGSASALVIDTLRLGSVGGETDWQSPDYAKATDRFHVEVHGGASNLSVVTE